MLRAVARRYGVVCSIPVVRPLRRTVTSSYGSLQDVVETEHILHADLGFPLPLVWAILEDAECWIHAIVHRSKVIKIHGENFDVEEEEAALYCIARLPLGAKEYKPLRRIVFTIEAHDQGECTRRDPSPSACCKALVLSFLVFDHDMVTNVKQQARGSRSGLPPARGRGSKPIRGPAKDNSSFATFPQTRNGIRTAYSGTIPRTTKSPRTPHFTSGWVASRAGSRSVSSPGPSTRAGSTSSEAFRWRSTAPMRRH